MEKEKEFKKVAKETLKPQVVIFDWDDTLIKSGHLFKMLFEKVMDTLNAPNAVREMREKYKHLSLKEAFPMVFGDDWKQAQELYYKYFNEIDSLHIDIMEHAEEVLRYFKENNVTMVVVSNKQGDILRSEVKYLGWNKYFANIVGASDAKRDKPWPDPAHLALSGLQFQNYKNIWFVGDSSVDAKCSHSISSQFVLFGDNGVHSEIESIQIPYLHTPNHQELILSYNAAKK